MKILYDHQIFLKQKFGGISRYFEELSQIKYLGVEVEMINPELIPKPATRTLLRRCIQYMNKKYYDTSEVSKARLPDIIIEKMGSGDYDIFHPTYYDSYFLEFINKPFVLTVYDMIHEIFPECFDNADNTSTNKRLLCQKAHQIIAISETTKNDLINIFNIPSEKIRTVHLGSNFDDLRSVIPVNFFKIKNYILYTGVRDGYKNFRFTVRALTDLLRADSSIQIVCTGKPFAPEEIGFFKELSIYEQVKHVNIRNDNELAWVYQNARCFIFPSLYEGFGFPLLEAFACGCPVVSSKGGSLKEIGGEGALFFDPKNFKQIQDLVSLVLYNFKVRDEMVENGKKQFKRYSWGQCRTETIEIYNSILVN